MNAASAGPGPALDEDGQLASRCKRGEPGAFAQLLRRHRKGVYRVAYAIVQDGEEAEDMAQEAFVRAYGAIQSFDHAYSFAAWVRRITVNCALSSLRKTRRGPRRSNTPTDLARSPSTDDPAGQAAASDLETAVRKSLDALPPRQRVAITLFALEDLDLASTAAAMGCAVGTVKAQLHRARQKLRELLADYLEEDEHREV